MQLTPLADRVIVKPIEESESTVSGIILPDTMDKEKPEKGEVIAVGPGKYEDGKLIPMGVKVGQKVVFKKYSPDEVKIDNVDYLILSESDLLAVIS